MRTPVLAAFFALVLIPGAAFAHAMGNIFALNLPFPYLALSAAVALGYSFAAFTVFAEPARTIQRRAGKTLATLPSGGVLALRLLGVSLIAVALLSGAAFLPSQLAPAIFWLVLMLGGLYASALIGGLWPLVNPLEKYASSHQVFPAARRYLPAFAAYIAIIVLEVLAGSAAAHPSVVMLVLSIYVFVSVGGASLYGVSWLEYGDLFGVLYGFAGRAAPLFFRGRTLELPSFASRLVEESAENFWALAFIVFMISSTSFDGLHATKLWQMLVGTSFAAGIAGLAATTVLMLGLYLAIMQLMRRIAGSGALDLRFAYALIPVAIGYNVAHYFTLLSGPVPQAAVWSVQICAVLAGHVYATYAAHRIALSEFPDEKNAALSHAPLLALMMAFTASALWILSLPVA